MYTNRNHWQVTFSVWHALFMREFVSRLMASRYAWFWLLAEPMLLVLIMVSIRLMVKTSETIAGSDKVVWMVLGLVAFFMLRDGVMRGMTGIQANRGLLSYRQIQPIDPVFIRVYVEGIIRFLVLVVLLFIFGLVGQDVIPNDFLMVLVVWFNIWLLGLAFGILFACLSVLLGSGFNKAVSFMMMPLLLLSGVIMPLHNVPPQILEYLMYNPIVHGLEYLRFVFFTRYYMVDGVDMLYFNYWVLGALLLGLTVYLRFEARIRMA